MLSIHIATRADIPLIRKLSLQVWPQTYDAILSKKQISYMLDLLYSAPALEQQMKSGHRFLIVANEGKDIGFASYSEEAPAIFKLHKLYVLTGQQGKGTGRFIIDYIISDIIYRGATALRLNVNRSNKAKEFYERLGFEVIREEDIDIGGGFFMNDYIMEKQLIPVYTPPSK